MNISITRPHTITQPLPDECASGAVMEAKLANSGHYTAWTGVRGALGLASWPPGMT